MQCDYIISYNFIENITYHWQYCYHKPNRSLHTLPLQRRCFRHHQLRLQHLTFIKPHTWHKDLLQFEVGVVALEGGSPLDTLPCTPIRPVHRDWCSPSRPAWSEHDGSEPAAPSLRWRSMNTSKYKQTLTIKGWRMRTAKSHDGKKESNRMEGMWAARIVYLGFFLYRSCWRARRRRRHGACRSRGAITGRHRGRPRKHPLPELDHRHSSAEHDQAT